MGWIWRTAQKCGYEIRNRAKRYDWRVWTIAVSLALSLAVTGVIYWYWGALKPDDHWGSVFTSWVGGVALFVVVGVATAIVSVARPELESFDTRARILFRRQSGKHIDYIVSQIKNAFAHYAERTTRTIMIEHFDEQSGLFRTAVETVTVVRGYIDDITTKYRSDMKVTKVTPPPPGGAPNSLVYLRVNGEPVMAGLPIIESLDEPFETEIHANNCCEVRHRFELWSEADTEPNRHWPARYTQVMEVVFENRLINGRDVLIRFCKAPGEFIDHKLVPGDSKTLLTIAEIEPMNLVYDFRISLA